MFQEFIILCYNQNHKYSWARSFLYQTNSESVLGSSPMTEPCLNNPCMMTFKTHYKSLSNKMLQTWMKLFHFNLTTSGCPTENRVTFPFWMGQISSRTAETASNIYVRAQISTFRPLVWNTTTMVGLKHLQPREASLQHNCLKAPAPTDGWGIHYGWTEQIPRSFRCFCPHQKLKAPEFLLF